MLKLRIPLLILVSSAILMIGAFFQAHLLLENDPDLDRQVFNRSVDLLIDAGPSYIYGQMAKMNNDASMATVNHLPDLMDMVKLGSRYPNNDLIKLARELILDSKADQFIVFDDAGTVIYRSSQPDQLGDSIKGLPSVQQALTGVISDDTMELDRDALYTACVPFGEGNGAVAGGVLYGFALKNTALEQWDSDLGAYIAFIWNGDLRAVSNITVKELVGNVLKNVKEEALVNALGAFPPDGRVLLYEGNQRMLVTGLPGQFHGKAGFVIVPRIATKLQTTTIFGVALELFMAVGIALLVAFLGAYWLLHSFNHDVDMLCEKVKQVRETGDTSVLQPQAFVGELRPLATTIRDNICRAAEGEIRRKSGNVNMDLGAVPRESAMSREVSPDRLVEDDHKLSQTAVSQLEELLKSSIGGGAAESPRPSRADAAAMAADDSDDGPDLANLLQEAMQPPSGGQQPKAYVPPAEKTADPATQNVTGDHIVKVTMHGGPGGVPVIRPEDLEEQRNPEVLRLFEQVFKDYIALRQRLGEPVDKLSKKKFFANLEENRRRIITKFKCRDVTFTVVEKEGKSSVKASPVR